nr:retrovirus-related Pol polyprotein from transposon TNT 1-94 [Tanacetum cinerariifolium]
MCEMIGQFIQKKHEEEQAANARYWKIPASCDDDDDYNFVVTPNEPVDSLSMGDEYLNTITATKLEKFNKSSDDQSCSDEDVPEKIFSNPLFDEEIISMKIDHHHFNAESDLIESLLNHDSSIISSFSKNDFLLDEFVGKLTLLKSIPPGIDETDCDPEEDIRLIVRLLYDNSSPRPSEEFVSKNSDAEIESFSPSPIPVKDSDSLMEEIDLSFNPEDPMPPGIEEDDNDSERDILILEELLNNYSLSLPENESFHFDILYLLYLAGSQPMLKSSNKAEDGVIISIPPLIGGVADVVVEIKGTDFCGIKGIKREFSVPRTPQQNGIAERKNRILIEATRTMLADSLLPIPFLAEAVNIVCYVQNRVLVTKPHNKTPYEILHGRSPSISFMRPFGCPVTILNTLDPLGKFKGKVDEGFLVGYSVNSKAFRVFNSRTCIVQETLHVNFLENKPNIAGSGPTWLFDIDSLTRTMNYQPNYDGDAAFDGKEHDFDAKKPESEVILSPSKFQDCSENSSNKVNAVGTIVPTIGVGGITYSDDENDVGAEADFNNLETSITEEPKRNKKDKRGIVVKNKARLVTQRHIQEKGIDYEEVFALVARIEAIRLFLAYASFIGFMVYQMDIKSAFLYGTIEEEVYVCQPSGFEDLIILTKSTKWSRHFMVYIRLLELVKKKKDGIFISQDKYVVEILRKFRLTEEKSASTPIDTEKHFLKDPDGEDVDVHTYRSMIGSLMYLTSSRPDIMFAKIYNWRMSIPKMQIDLLAVKEANSCCHFIHRG